MYIMYTYKWIFEFDSSVVCLNLQVKVGFPALFFKQFLPSSIPSGINFEVRENNLIKVVLPKVKWRT